MKPADIGKLDRLTSKICRSRGACERCGSTYQLQTSHIVGRKIHSTRWQQANVLCLCASCHAYFTDRPFAHAEFLTEYLGYEHLQRLNEMSRVLAPDIKPRLTFADVKELIEADIDEWERRVKP